MAFQTKKSVMAITKEVTEGVAVPPTAGTQYVALQDGFDLEPAFNTLENAELTGSIGPAKPIQGLEAPTASLSHYLRHSGVEGQEPNYGLLLEGAFGTKEVNSTEYDLVGGSTAGSSSLPPVLNVDAGEGVNFERGHGLLIKDGVNGYSIRNVKSVSVDALTLNFNLPGAPALGVNLGKAVQYKPSEDHPTLSVWDFRGGGAAIELITGARVLEMSMEAAAGELINGSFSLEGINYSYDPITIDATNDDMDFDDGGGEENVSVPQKTYKDPHELAAALEVAMNAATLDTITVKYNDCGANSGKYTISTSGGTLSLLWDTGANSASTIGTALGFVVTADDTGATTYTSDNKISLTRYQTPNFDDADPLVAKNNEVLLGGFDYSVCFCPASISMTLSNTKTDDLSVCAESGKAATVITGRSVTVEMSGTLESHDVDKFKRFRANETTEFAYNFGIKSGGNWVAGKSANIYLPSATVSSFKLGDGDGLVTLEMTLTAFVDNERNGEVYLNLL